MLPSNSPEKNSTPTPRPYDDHAGIADFPQLGVMAFLLLTLVSMGGYFVYWMYHRTMILNRQLGDQGISVRFVNLSVTAYIIYMGLALYIQLEPARINVMLVYGIFALICNILYLVWIFKIRNRLNLVLQIGQGHTHWLKASWTFLLHAFYVQYKINQIQGDETNHLIRRYTREL